MDEALESASEREPLAEGQESPLDEFSNPPGVSRGSCDTAEGADGDPDCGLEVTAQVKDQVLEETKPGIGIPGFEGEEVGGG
jgi:hypothetical protein